MCVNGFKNKKTHNQHSHRILRQGHNGAQNCQDKDVDTCPNAENIRQSEQDCRIASIRPISEKPAQRTAHKLAQRERNCQQIIQRLQQNRSDTQRICPAVTDDPAHGHNRIWPIRRHTHQRKNVATKTYNFVCLSSSIKSFLSRVLKLPTLKFKHKRV
jgi:hypothetical protein